MSSVIEICGYHRSSRAPSKETPRAQWQDLQEDRYNRDAISGMLRMRKMEDKVQVTSVALGMTDLMKTSIAAIWRLNESKFSPLMHWYKYAVNKKRTDWDFHRSDLFIPSIKHVDSIFWLSQELRDAAENGERDKVKVVYQKSDLFASVLGQTWLHVTKDQQKFRLLVSTSFSTKQSWEWRSVINQSGNKNNIYKYDQHYTSQYIAPLVSKDCGIV